jgi:sugar lactone lactonase YvrE
MFFIDSKEYCVFAYDFDLGTGEITNKKVELIIDKEMGMPDGMTIDDEDNLWIALWGGNSVIKYNTSKNKITDIIEVDAPNVTSCTLGGEKLSTLFITTATEELTSDQLLKFPLSGSLFSYNPNVKGVKANSFCSAIRNE